MGQWRGMMPAWQRRRTSNARGIHQCFPGRYDQRPPDFFYGINPGGADRIFPENIGEFEYMRRGRNVLGIEFVQLRDVFEYVAELYGEFLDLGLAEFQAGQLRNVQNIFA